MPETLVLPNVYGLVLRTGDAPAVLIQKRWKPDSDPDNLGRWELPGGKWRAFEPIEGCLRREVEEETGVTALVVGQDVAQHAPRGQTVQVSRPDLCVQMVDGPYPSVLLVYVARGSGRPRSRGDGARDAQWMPVDALRAELDRRPESFTPLSYAGLREAIGRGLI